MIATFEGYVAHKFREAIRKNAIDVDEAFHHMGFTPWHLGESVRDFLMSLNGGEIWRRLFVYGRFSDNLQIKSIANGGKKMLADVFNQAILDLRNKYEFVEDIVESMAFECSKYDTPLGFFEDLQKSGCASGMINMFVYTNERKEFYCNYLDDLEEFMKHTKGKCGRPIKNVDGLPRYDFVCWTCYEELGRLIVSRLWPKSKNSNIKNH